MVKIEITLEHEHDGDKQMKLHVHAKGTGKDGACCSHEVTHANAIEFLLGAMISGRYTVIVLTNEDAEKIKPYLPDYIHATDGGFPINTPPKDKMN